MADMIEPFMQHFRENVATRAMSCKSEHAFYEWGPQLTRYGFDVDFPLFNGALSARLSDQEAREHMVEDKLFFQERRVPFTWWVEPDAQPTEIERILKSEGFKTPGAFAGLVADIRKVTDWGEPPPGVEVREVADEETFRKFLEVTASAFSISKGSFHRYGRAINNYGVDGPWRHYLGYLNGEAVGGMSLFVSSVMSGVQHGAVFPSARYRGVGTAMIRQCLKDALEMGCDHCSALLMADRQAQKLCDRYGFQECCHVTPYIYGAETREVEPTARSKRKRQRPSAVKM